MVDRVTVGGYGDGVNELGVDGVDKVDVVGKLILERFECLASESGTGNKSNPERSPSAAKAAKISSRSVRSRVDRHGWELEEDEDCEEILKPTPHGGLQNDILSSG